LLATATVSHIPLFSERRGLKDGHLFFDQKHTQIAKVGPKGVFRKGVGSVNRRRDNMGFMLDHDGILGGGIV
jgi:hypothetical protein